MRTEAVPAGLLLAVSVTAVVTLHRWGAVTGLGIAWENPWGWMAAASPDLAVAAVARVAGLLIGWWVLVTTAAYGAARRTGRGRLAGLLRPVTLPLARRLVDRAVGAVLLVGAVGAVGAAPAGAQEAVGVEQIVDAAAQVAEDAAALLPLPPALQVPALPGGGTPAPPADVPGGSASPPGADETAGAATPSEPGQAGRPGPAEHSSPSAPAGQGAGQALDPATPATYTVVPGDHLWGIAARHVAAARGVDPAGLADRDVHAYWVRLIAANHGALRSGDPDLIYPGEVLLLPAVEAPS